MGQFKRFWPSYKHCRVFLFIGSSLVIHYSILTFSSIYILQCVIIMEQFKTHFDMHNYLTHNSSKQSSNILLPYTRLAQIQKGWTRMPLTFSIKYQHNSIGNKHLHHKGEGVLKNKVILFLWRVPQLQISLKWMSLKTEIFSVTAYLVQFYICI